MSFKDILSARLPFSKKEEVVEYYFALNISAETLEAVLWTTSGNKLQILDSASHKYSSHEEILKITDQLLDTVLGDRAVEPQKILFGVPDSWLMDENLKDEYLKILRQLVKELELTPMAYVATSHALVHFLEKSEGVPTTAILIGFEDEHLEVTVVRAGKIDGTKVLTRGENSGADIEKALLSFSDVETLPSKLLIYGEKQPELEKLKNQLLSFSWMSKLSFLHFPKIDILPDKVTIKSICFAGGSEINSNVVFVDNPAKTHHTKPILISDEEPDEKLTEKKEKEDIGFMVGDVSEIGESQPQTGGSLDQVGQQGSELEDETLITDSPIEEESNIVESEDFTEESTAVAPELSQELEKENKRSKSLSLVPFIKKIISEGKNLFIPKNKFLGTFLFGVLAVIILLFLFYLFLVKAQVKIFVEPKILEKDTQVTADPNQKKVDEDAKIIPGQVVQTEISGTAKDTASGKKQIGDPAKGTVVLYNKTFESKQLSKGTVLTSSSGLKFSLDTSVNIASQSATDSGITFGKTNTTLTAQAVGADGNLPSGSELTVGGFSSSQVSAKAEGNFSGGTSKSVTVVSSEDQQRLLASLTSDLRKKAQQKLQEKFPNTKILEEALAEQIGRKSYSKNINDQANEFSLELTIAYKGTTFDEKDLKQIVSKLVTTQVPDGFTLDLSETETQADVSKLEKDGKLIFLARFKAKLLPKLDVDKIKDQIKGKTPSQVNDSLKSIDNILGADIKITPSLPKILQRLPLLKRSITVEVGLK